MKRLILIGILAMPFMAIGYPMHQIEEYCIRKARETIDLCSQNKIQEARSEWTWYTNVGHCLGFYNNLPNIHPQVKAQWIELEQQALACLQ